MFFKPELRLDWLLRFYGVESGSYEVVFGLRAEVEALKARLTQIERGQEVAVSAAYWQAVERERDSSEKKKRQLL